jgi:hypothetical protein
MKLLAITAVVLLVIVPPLAIALSMRTIYHDWDGDPFDVWDDELDDD